MLVKPILFKCNFVGFGILVVRGRKWSPKFSDTICSQYSVLYSYDLVEKAVYRYFSGDNHFTQYSVVCMCRDFDFTRGNLDNTKTHLPC